MHITALREWIAGLEQALIDAYEILRYHHPHHHIHPHENRMTSRITIVLHNLKFSSMKSSIKLPTGTPLTGHCSPLDVKGNVLPPSAYKTGSVKYSIAPNADGTPNANYTVAAGATEEDFVVTEVNPGNGGTGSLLQDSQDVDGNALPQAVLDFEFDVVPAKAVDSVIVPDQASH